MNSNPRIGVLAGGDSPERDVSLVSGNGVFKALEDAGHRVELISIDSLDDLVARLEGIDVVFNCLHGGSGEDGTVQLLLDVMEVPYAGSRAQACARAMDKEQSKSLFTLMGIPTPESAVYKEGDLDAFVEEACSHIDFPMVVKPISAGSTIGVHIVQDTPALRAAIASVVADFSAALVEAFIAGRELTVGILWENGAHRPLRVIEIRTPEDFFDFTAKYTEGVAEFLVPANLPEATAAKVQETALRAHEALGCFGYSRVDFRLSTDGIPYVLEANTLPGMTPMSDLPRAAAADGIPYLQLIELMLQTAFEEGPA